jgi:hypothetical protein
MAKTKYQIIFNRGHGSKSFEYFDSEKKTAPIAAATVANAYIERQYSFQRMFSSFKAPRSVQVVEFDNVKKKAAPKATGHRFKLRLVFFQATYNSGRKERSEWYELSE